MNKVEFDVNLIMKTDDIIRCWEIIKKLITEEFKNEHPEYSFAAFNAINDNIENFKKEMETLVVEDIKYSDSVEKLSGIRDTISSIVGDQVNTISVNSQDAEVGDMNEDLDFNIPSEEDEKAKAKSALEAAFAEMRRRGAHIEEVTV